MAGVDHPPPPIRILIVGAGAVGLFYSSRLHQPQNNVFVSLVCRSNYKAIKANGVKLLTHTFGEYSYRPENTFHSVGEASKFIKFAPSTSRVWDYVVVTTKALPSSSNSVESEANLIKPVVGPGTTIVLIQNGIGIERPYHDAFPDNILLSAVTVVSAEQTEHGVVRQNRWTRISIGPWMQGKGDEADGISKTREFCALLKAGGIKDAEEYEERELQFVRWHKIAINAAFNPSSVLSNGAPNSDMAADALLREHIVGIMNEILRLASAILQSPIPPKFATPEQIIQSTLRNTRQNFDNKTKPQSNNSKPSNNQQGESSRPSMWYDWAQGRPMELEVILGNVVREAKRVGIEVPRVQSMYALLCMAQRRRDEQVRRAKAKL
ncbi:hypothetical protein FRC14_005877 [Serendipita sp. 396]|nr:hypothetical protein FRC14_005877 [Serendipita sp. 396]